LICENRLVRIREYKNKRSAVRITSRIRAGTKCHTKF